MNYKILKRHISLSFFLTLNFSIFSQSIDTKYVLAKAIGAGCGSGNVLLEQSKKVHLKGNTELAEFSIKSLACTNKVNMLGLPTNHDDEKAVYLYAEKAIVLVLYKDNSIAIIGKEREGVYTIVSVGAADKKAAKALSHKIGKNYDGDFSRERLAKLFKEQEAMAEAKAARENLVDFPDKGFSKAKGIGGLYHLSKPIKVAENPSRYTNTLQVEYLPSDLDNIMLYGPLDQKMKGLCQSKKYQVEHNMFSWNFNHHYLGNGVNISNVFNNKYIMLLEPGVILIDGIPPAYYEEKGVVNSEKLKAEINKRIIMTTSKSRLQELVNNPMEVGELIIAFWNKNTSSREKNQMKANPLPAENIAMKNYRAKALSAMRLRAKKDRWKSSIEAAFVEENTWRIIKHNITGRILYRQIGCVMFEKKDGKCKWRRFSIKQEYNGSGYNKTPICNNYSTAYYYAIDCKKATSYK